MSNIIRNLQELTVDTVLVEHVVDASTLRKMLTSAIYSQKMKNSLLLLSTAHVIDVFEMVRNKSLESPTIRWIVIMEEDIRGKLQNVLREGTQVAVAVRKQNSTTDYHIYSSYVNVSNQYSFKHFVHWRPSVEIETNCDPELSSEIVKVIGQGQIQQDIHQPHGQGQRVGCENEDDGTNCNGKMVEYKGQKVKFQGQIAEPEGQWAEYPGDSWYQQRALFPPLDVIYDDFQGRRLVLSAVENVPYFKLSRLENGTVVPESGVDFRLMETLGQSLNFTFRILEPPDGRFGDVEANGSVSGIVGMVANRRAHFGINEITITGGYILVDIIPVSRETVTDFSIPYILEGTNLVSKAPTVIDPVFAIFQPFTLKTWLLLIATVIIIGPVTYGVRRCNDSLNNQRNHEMKKALFISPKDFTIRNPKDSSHVLPIPENSIFTTQRDPSVSGSPRVLNYCFNMFRYLVGQGSVLVEKSLSSRIVFGVWFVFCMVIYSVYSGKLTSFMTIPTYEKPIDSPEDLLDANKDGLVPAVQPSTSNEYFFRVLTEDIVYMSGNLNTEIRTRQRGRHLFHLSREKFQVQGFGIVCQTGAPYIQNVNNELLKISQAGLVNKWIREEVRKLSNFIKPRTGKPGDAQSLTLRHLQASFYVLLTGFSFSLIFFITEIISMKKITQGT
ncbi:glutamate receptor ionotropic, kainate 2-like [Palaemon carinicauda]|uniref:glutamate receptor ionotropic, kainate 2-like n=1 Tax=Palaemon carinicauda TaxID=392227 RepID=UPI0035B69C37